MDTKEAADDEEVDASGGATKVAAAVDHADDADFGFGTGDVICSSVTSEGGNTELLLLLLLLLLLPPMEDADPEDEDEEGAPPPPSPAGKGRGFRWPVAVCSESLSQSSRYEEADDDDDEAGAESSWDRDSSGDSDRFDDCWEPICRDEAGEEVTESAAVWPEAADSAGESREDDKDDKG
jgi:hypothetical protein